MKMDYKTGWCAVASGFKRASQNIRQRFESEGEDSMGVSKSAGRLAQSKTLARKLK